MLQCVLYVFLGGMAMINSGCALDSDYVLVDRIEHVQSYAPQYALTAIVTGKRIKHIVTSLLLRY